MEEMKKDLGLESEIVENDIVNNDNAQNVEATEKAAQSPDNEVYYTYTQGTQVTPDQNLVAASAPAVKDKAKSKATTALVLGIIALVSNCLCGCCCLPIPVILGIISLVMANKSKKLSADGKFSGLAIGALICAIFAIIGYVITLLMSGLYALLFLTDPEGKAMINDFLADYGYELAF